MANNVTWFIYTLSDPRAPGVVRYVGKTSKSLRERLMGHLWYARKAASGTHLVRWLNSLQAEGLVPEILQIDQGSGDWEAAERHWIAWHRQQGYDLCNTADGGEGASPGFVVSEATRAKISVANKGRKPSPEARARMSAARQGRGPVLTAESYERMSRTKTGRPGPKPSPETVAKRVATVTRTWEKKLAEGWKPPPCTPEGRARTTAANTGRACSEETKSKIGEANRGRVMSAEARAKMSAAKKGQSPHNKGKPGPKASEETRAKLAVAHKAAWARRKAAQSEVS